MHRANRDLAIAWRSSGQTLTAARLATSTQRQNDDRVEVEAGREEEAAVRAGNWLARRERPAATFCRRACLPKSESDSKCTEWVPPTVGKSPMGARRIQRAMKAQIAPPKAAVEARTCAWAGRATSRGERSRAAGLAPPAERCERPVARFGLDPPGGPAADGTAGRAPGGRRGRDRRQGRKSHSESVWSDPSATFNDRDSYPGPRTTPKFCSSSRVRRRASR
jgi:hypothetical protein